MPECKRRSLENWLSCLASLDSRDASSTLAPAWIDYLQETLCTDVQGAMFGLAGSGGNVQGYNAEFTWVAFLCCLMASSGGALFGYDNGKSL